jgi:carbamate kinase
MPKRGISVTLGADNLLWLRTQAAAGKRRSLSEALDRIVSEARLSGRVADAAITTVVGTIDIAGDDPALDTADEYIGELFGRSSRQLVQVRERSPRYAGADHRSKRRRG